MRSTLRPWVQPLDRQSVAARSSSARVGSGPPARSWRRMERRRAWLSASQARSWAWRADGYRRISSEWIG
jgi:hypothetical protein